jgi:mono/diheme cytochrome c family protein
MKPKHGAFMKQRSILLFCVVFLLTVSSFLFFNFAMQDSQPANKEWVAPAWADTLNNPLKGNEEATQKGKEIFQNTCALCHGQTGKGDGPAGAALQPHPKNLTSEKVQSQTDGAIFWKITTGNPPMASYKDVFSETQRWQLIDYIRLLGKKQDKK